LPHHHRLPRCYFFLSYARDDDSASIQQFYQDLCAEVREHAGLDRGTEVGFLDVHSMDIGVPWSARLVRELARCGTFLALISRRYLSSEMCGREWTVFARRLSSSVAPGEETPPALLPLQWIPQQVLPQVVGEFQYQNDLLPPAYEARGLRQMIRLDRYRNDYLEFVDMLAQQIVRLAEEDAVAPSTLPLDIAEVRSAFHQPILVREAAAPTGPTAKPAAANNHEVGVAPASAVATTGTGGATSTTGAADGGQGVRFVVAAPSITDLRSASIAPLGRETHFYGPAATDWAPYLPELATSLATYAQQVADQQQFSSIVTDVASLPEALAEARSTGDAVVLLIDLWVTYLEDSRRILRQYDRPEPNDAEPPTAVMVPVSAADPHTQERHEELTHALRDLLSNRLGSLDGVMSRTSILSVRSFDADLRVVLERVRNRVFRTRPPYHRPAGRPGNRPILQGP